jgi:hypothetical protein
MFTTGTMYDFEARLHALPTGVTDLDSYETEGLDYIASIDESLIDKWNREFDKKSQSIYYTSERPF